MIRVDRSLLKAIRDDPGSIVVQVVGGPEDSLTEALRRATKRIMSLGSGWRADSGTSPIEPMGPKFISGPSLAKPGPILYIDGGDTGVEALLTIPRLIADEMEALGVRNGRITSPGPASFLVGRGGLTSLGVDPALLLRLYPDPPMRPAGYPTRPPKGWLSPVWEWLQTESRGTEITAIVWGSQFTMESADARTYLEQTWDRSSSAYLVAGESNARLTVAHTMLSLGTVTLAIGGDSLARQDWEIAVDRLKDLARRLAADLSYACLGTGPLRWTMNSIPPDSRLRSHDAAKPELVQMLCDEVAFDAYHFQILCPRHIARFDAPLAGGMDLPGGRVEYVFGNVNDWLTTTARVANVQAEARNALSPCLITEEEAAEMWRLRSMQP